MCGGMIKGGGTPKDRGRGGGGGATASGSKAAAASISFALLQVRNDGGEEADESRRHQVTCLPMCMRALSILHELTVAYPCRYANPHPYPTANSPPAKDACKCRHCHEASHGGWKTSSGVAAILSPLDSDSQESLPAVANRIPTPLPAHLPSKM